MREWQRVSVLVPELSRPQHIIAYYTTPLKVHQQKHLEPNQLPTANHYKLNSISEKYNSKSPIHKKKKKWRLFPPQPNLFFFFFSIAQPNNTCWPLQQSPQINDIRRTHTSPESKKKTREIKNSKFINLHRPQAPVRSIHPLKHSPIPTPTTHTYKHNLANCQTKPVQRTKSLFQKSPPWQPTRQTPLRSHNQPGPFQTCAYVDRVFLRLFPSSYSTFSVPL